MAMAPFFLDTKKIVLPILAMSNLAVPLGTYFGNHRHMSNENPPVLWVI